MSKILNKVKVGKVNLERHEFLPHFNFVKAGEVGL